MFAGHGTWCGSRTLPSIDHGPSGPSAINLGKELSNDKNVLDELSIERNSASYKISRWVGKTFTSEIIQKMKTNHFNLNLDERTSSNNKKIVTVLVNVFSDSDNDDQLEHLVSEELISVNSASLFDIIVEQIESQDIYCMYKFAVGADGLMFCHERMQERWWDKTTTGESICLT